MKKRMLLLVALVAAVNASAQSVGHFCVATDFGTGIALSEPASTPLLWRVTGYYNVGKRFSVGVGTGLSLYEKTLIPVFADMRLLLTRPHRVTPYLQCGAGYAFAPDPKANGGSMLAPAIGVRYALPKGLHLFLAAGYERQRLERLKEYSGDAFSAQFGERLSHHTITLRAGLLF